MKALWKKFVKDERGLETVEWAIVGAIVVAATVAVITGIATNVAARFGTLQEMTN